MKILVPACFAFACVMPSLGATITAQLSCTTMASSAILTSANPVCNQFSLANGDQASGLVNVSYSVTGNQIIFGGNISAFAASAGAVVGGETISDLLSNIGPLRSGYFVVSASNSGSETNSGQATANLAVSEGATAIAQINCASQFLGALCTPNSLNNLPVTLGEPLEVSATVNLQVAGSQSEALASDQFQIELTFFNADGSPANLSILPEPSAPALSGLGALSLLLWRLKSARRRFS